jgi:hydrogenase expression/formation protein HypC
MRILEVHSQESGTVDLNGTRYQVNLSLVEDPKPHEYVIVHAGFAIERLEQEEARQRLALFDRMAEIYREELGSEVRLLAPLQGPLSARESKP